MTAVRTSGSGEWLSCHEDDAPIPAPTHGLAVFDSLTNAYMFDGPDASNDAILYRTTADLTSITIMATQGIGGSSYAVKFMAPVEETPCLSGTVRVDTDDDDTLNFNEPGIPG